MTNEVLLLLLRIASSAILIMLLGALFVLILRDYRSAANQIEANRRSYGRLIELHEVNGTYLPTGEFYPLLPLTSLGRSPTNTIALQDSFASGEHAVVALRGGQWWLEDRQSRNGTTLNEELIHQPVVITNGDIVGIGTIRFRLELE